MVIIFLSFDVGTSVSLSTDGKILAVGAPYDDSFVGSVFIFIYDGSAYQQLGGKLVGAGYTAKPLQGVYDLEIYRFTILRLLSDFCLLLRLAY